MYLRPRFSQPVVSIMLACVLISCGGDDSRAPDPSAVGRYRVTGTITHEVLPSEAVTGTLDLAVWPPDTRPAPHTRSSYAVRNIEWNASSYSIRSGSRPGGVAEEWGVHLAMQLYVVINGEPVELFGSTGAYLFDGFNGMGPLFVADLSLSDAGYELTIDVQPAD